MKKYIIGILAILGIYFVIAGNTSILSRFYATLMQTDSVKYNPTTTVYPFTWVIFHGNSYTTGTGATTLDSTYPYVMALSYLGSYGLTSYGVSGTGMLTAAGSNLANVNKSSPDTNTAMISVLVGLNDFRRSGYNVLTFKKFINGYMSIWANTYIKNWTAGFASGGAITRYGSWTSYNGASVGGKSGANLAAYTGTFNDSLVYVQPTADSTIYVGFIGSKTQFSPSVQVYIDGVRVDSFSLNNQYDSITDGGSYGDNSRGPMGRLYRGLSLSSPHRLKIINSASGNMPVDYVGSLLDASSTMAKPLLAFHIPYLPASGYAVSPNLGSLATTDSANYKMDSLFNALPKYTVYIVNTNAFTNTTTDMFSDSIHRNNQGYRHIAQGALSALPLSIIGVNASVGNSLFTNSRVQVGTNNGVQKVAWVSDILGAAGGDRAVQYSQSGVTTGDPYNFPWDYTNKRLGIGGGAAATPAEKLHISWATPTIRLDDTTATVGTTFITGYHTSLILASNRNPATGTIINSSLPSAQISIGVASNSGNVAIFATNTNNAAPLQLWTFSGDGKNIFGGNTSNTGAATFQLEGATAPGISMYDTASGGVNAGYVITSGDRFNIGVNRNPTTGVFKTSARAASEISLYGVNGSGAIEFYTSAANNTTPTIYSRLEGTGAWTWQHYGAGTNTGTAAFNLSVTSSGSVIETAVSAGTPTLQQVLTAGKTFTSTTLSNGSGTDSLLTFSTSGGVATVNKIAQFPTLASGSYTPTLTNTTNISSSSLSQATYTQVGNIVTVTVGGSLTPTLVATNSTLTITLPVTAVTTTQSNIGSGSIAFNSGGNLYSGMIANIASGTTATINFFVGSVNTSSNFAVTFQYKIN